MSGEKLNNNENSAPANNQWDSLAQSPNWDNFKHTNEKTTKEGTVSDDQNKEGAESIDPNNPPVKTTAERNY